MFKCANKNRSIDWNPIQKMSLIMAEITITHNYILITNFCALIIIYS